MKIGDALMLDVYSLGQTLRHMVTGVCPDEKFDKSRRVTLVAGLLAPVRQVARCCCAKSNWANAGKKYKVCEVSELSPEVNDLLKKMTAPTKGLALFGRTPINRITAAEACSHKWIHQGESPLSQEHTHSTMVQFTFE